MEYKTIKVSKKNKVAKIEINAATSVVLIIFIISLLLI